MTRCTFHVPGRTEREECGNRACKGWLGASEVMPRCTRHLSREAHEAAAEQGLRLIDLETVGTAAGRHK